MAGLRLELAPALGLGGRICTGPTSNRNGNWEWALLILAKRLMAARAINAIFAIANSLLFTRSAKLGKLEPNVTYSGSGFVFPRSSVSELVTRDAVGQLEHSLLGRATLQHHSYRCTEEKRTETGEKEPKKELTTNHDINLNVCRHSMANDRVLYEPRGF